MKCIPGCTVAQETQDGTTTYTYDLANRLVEVDGVVTYAATYAPYGEGLAGAGEQTDCYIYNNDLRNVTFQSSTPTPSRSSRLRSSWL